MSPHRTVLPLHPFQPLRGHSPGVHSMNHRHAISPRSNILSFRDTGYRYSDRDPDLSFIISAIHQSNLSISELQERCLDATNNTGWIAYTTINNWLTGKTRRPQNRSLNIVAQALGYTRQWTRRNSSKSN